MKLMLAIYFFILAIIQMGLFFGISHYYRSQNLVRPSPYWMNSLLVSILGLIIFGAGIVTIEDVAKPEFNFTVANTLLYIAIGLQAIFCYSLNQPISKILKIGFFISAILFLIVFEFMRVHSTFEVRTTFMCMVASVFYIWQILEIRRKRKQIFSNQLTYLQYASTAELFFAIGRMAILVAGTFTIRQVDQIPQFLILFTIAQLVMNTLSYIAIGGYWAEQITIANVKSHLENEEIKALLKEREALIGSLLKANKTASTGALSASIAHELNQPLGASSLNIQFLQKKLADGDLDPSVQSEILNTLLVDNNRAANIIRSLRSIFSEKHVVNSKVDLSDLIDTVLDITKPECIARNIQIILRLQPGLILQANAGEIQQVLLNLVNNSIQALENSSQGHKKLTIEGVHTEGGIRISVADNGDGITTDTQSQLFELLSSNKRNGMGLGLWLCKHIVTRHGGSIWFESNLGGGAKFLVQLPLNTQG
ncbi:sensor histidine kinase [Polynucleobacter asymbioticus]|uniref:histidine kinase n=1 Tax=Polynucleobacter asymbioticus (strain DSM 18221 / CIP 109841 / QLW-P1DMWA-1) TaxID=312153 RepID=A4SXT7_POLAQ|nr:HAMP domain-containing sensor histidine kinase [Polynucleobacter asymbioticus]ABP34301.1 integral membrane sensor signal transduction histidine kinase [Polynucleobacter asymbioticus QLW-P1DMWA-1]